MIKYLVDALTWQDEWGKTQGPIVLPLPVSVQMITSGVPVTLQADGSPLYLEFICAPSWYWPFYRSTTFTTSSPALHNLGIYGPGATSIGPPFGRSRAPKLGISDGTNNSCTNNLPAGIYYLVLRNGTDGAPLAPITVNVK